MSFLQIITIACLSLFLLLGGFLISSDRTGASGFIWLGLFFVMLGINFLDGLLQLTGFYLQYPGLAFWEDPLVLTYGPLIWFFAQSYTQNRTVNWYRGIYHLIPFLLLEIVLVYLFFSTEQESRRALLYEIQNFELSGDQLLVVFPPFLHVFIYMHFSRLKLIRFRQKLREYYATLPTEWYMTVVNFTLLIFCLSLFTSLIQLSGIPEYYQWSLMILNVIMTVLTYAILLRALKEPVMSIPDYEQVLGEQSDREIILVQQGITQLLKKEKLYSDPDLTLEKLAAKMNVSPRNISKVINQTLGQNFYDLVNNYRIEEAKTLLQDPVDPGQTILEVLYRVGYNSKSSFNTQFRKRTGVTPTDYKNLFKKT